MTGEGASAASSSSAASQAAGSAGGDDVSGAGGGVVVKSPVPFKVSGSTFTSNSAAGGHGGEQGLQ